MSEYEELSDNDVESKKLAKLVDILACEVDEARTVLSLSSGNLGDAVRLYFEQQKAGQDSVGTDHNISDDINANIATTAPDPDPEGPAVRRAIPSTVQRLADDAEFTASNRKDFRIIHEPFRSFAYERSRRMLPVGVQLSTYRGRNLASMFEPPSEMITLGGIDRIREKAQAVGKWVMVNVQDPEEFQSQVLNRDVWSDLELKRLIRERFLFTQLCKSTIESDRFVRLYHITEFPAICILDPLTGAKERFWNIQEKSITADELMEDINEFLERNQMYVVNDDGSLSAKKMPKSIADEPESVQIAKAMEESLKTFRQEKLKEVADDEEDDDDFFEYDLDEDASDSHVVTSSDAQIMTPKTKTATDMFADKVTISSNSLKRKRVGVGVGGVGGVGDPDSSEMVDLSLSSKRLRIVGEGRDVKGGKGTNEVDSPTIMDDEPPLIKERRAEIRFQIPSELHEDGSVPLVKTFDPDRTLMSDVRNWISVALYRKNTEISFVLPHPRKVVNEFQMESTLADLGLVDRVVLIVVLKK